MHVVSLHDSDSVNKPSLPGGIVFVIVLKVSPAFCMFSKVNHCSYSTCRLIVIMLTTNHPWFVIPMSIGTSRFRRQCILHNINGQCICNYGFIM